MRWLKTLFRRFAGRRAEATLRQDLSVAFVGHGAQRALRLVAFLIMTRVLTVEAYALFALAYTCFEIAVYASDLGLNVGVVRFVSKGLRKGDEAATTSVLRSVFRFKIVAGLAVGGLGYFLAPPLARAMNTPDLVPYLRIAFAGVLGMHLHRFYEAYFRSRLEFRRNALFSLIVPGLIAVAVGLLWGRESLTALRCQGVYAVAPLVASAFAATLLPHGFLRAARRDDGAPRQVWRFGRWVYLTNVLGKVRSKLNAILLIMLATLTDVGLYAYADRLAGVLSLVSTTLTTVYMPRASHLLTRDEYRNLLRKTYRAFFWFVPLLVLLPWVIRPLIRLHKPEYVEAAPLFMILFVSILFTVAALPARTVLYSINRPQVETIIQVIALAVALGFGIALIRAHGVVGAAYAMLIQRGISATILMGYVYRAVYRGPVERAGDPYRDGEAPVDDE
jgi:O-antigen/teichoic acid export membrane protein